MKRGWEEGQEVPAMEELPDRVSGRKPRVEGCCGSQSLRSPSVFASKVAGLQCLI